VNTAYVDANVILRFLTGDPPELATRARELFLAVERSELHLLVDEIVIAEVVWVLQSFYNHKPTEIARVLYELLSDERLEVSDRPGTLAALRAFSEKNVDFVDAMLAAHMARQGVREIYTFDHHFDRLPGIVRLTPGD
jgi:predicted nucleic acid-binding protein